MARRTPPMLRTLLIAAAVTAASGPRAALATPPTPLAPSLFSFPGSSAGPASAASAGLALADRWLGDEPFANPAIAPGLHAAGSGALLHVSRQDLRAGNRNFDETPAFFDGAGLAVGVPAPGPLALALYAYQPVLRREENAFTRGIGTPDPANPPALIQTRASERELRAGLAASAGVGPGRIGVGIEWTRRQDTFRENRTGVPDQGPRRLTLSGDGVGFQVGARVDRGDSPVGRLSLGLGARYLPVLKIDAPHAETLLVGITSDTLHAEREAGWEVGVTGRYAVSPAFRALAAVGGRTAQRWAGFDLRSGPAWEWKLAGEFHDVRDPWTLRFGIGQERQSNVPESRADVLALGFGWRFARATADVGLVHRTIAREAAPNSFDDRIVLTVGTPR